MRERGWFKIHRKILDSKHSRNMEMMGFWLYLLAKTYHKDTPNQYGVIIPSGSFDTGRKQISFETGLSESKVERFLKKLEIGQQIEQQKTTKYRIISIINWQEYQTGEQQIEQQSDNKRTTSGQQADTLKECNNTKNVKNIYTPDFDQFWKHYPKKASKPVASKAFKKVIKSGVKLNTLLEAIKRHSESRKWKEGFIPNPATFLNQEQFNDELEPILKQPENDEDLIAFFEEKLNGN